ncbi:glycoside hydrolase superfamily [Aspergillus bertholletiae]|uniref:Glycoside hydrolase superfamily n=1 Tax=Aspergillus bertholletiae TaxID=1226010 RepID=A0A5N7BPQ5_9EURO|nr:glycoside hydrolase superfamily [Aspergillus bertholletiae]
MKDSNYTPPTAEDIFRYRYQHGTNLGSMFVHGPWLSDDVSTRISGGAKELEEVKRSLKACGLEETRSKWEAYWQTALTDFDIIWLKDVARCNSIRIPMGFFTLGPVFCTGTEFEGEPSEVYVNCWNILKHLVEKCYHHGIGVLIDFQTIPGSVDRNSEIGIADFCVSERNWSMVTDCVAFIVQEVTYHAMSGVIGVQISSETDWKTCDLQKWYDEVLEITSCVNPFLPIYISDGGSFPEALDYAMVKNRLQSSVTRSPIIVDTHKYYTTGSYQHMDPMAVISRVHNALPELSTRQGRVGSQRTAVEAYIGQYSCAMDAQTWGRVDASERRTLAKAFGQEQSKQWESKACGSAFVGFKIHRITGDGWDFERQVSADAIQPPSWLAIPRAQAISKIAQAEAQRLQSQTAALSQHSDSPDTREHRQYALGWDFGFNDGLNFFSALSRDVIAGGWNGGDKIGAMELWIRKRLADTGKLNEDFAEQWESGFRKGVSDFYDLVGINTNIVY